MQMRGVVAQRQKVGTTAKRLTCRQCVPRPRGTQRPYIWLYSTWPTAVLLFGTFQPGVTCHYLQLRVDE